MASKRVYVENLAWNLSRRDLVEAVSQHGGYNPENVQIIRKGSASEASWPGRKCSAIFTMASVEDAAQLIVNLNQVDYRFFLHVLAAGSTSLRAKFAYPEGTRSVAYAKTIGYSTSMYQAQHMARPMGGPQQPAYPPPGMLLAAAAPPPPPPPVPPIAPSAVTPVEPLLEAAKPLQSTATSKVLDLGNYCYII